MGVWGGLSWVSFRGVQTQGTPNHGALLREIQNGPFKRQMRLLPGIPHDNSQTFNLAELFGACRLGFRV